MRKFINIVSGAPLPVAAPKKGNLLSLLESARAYEEMMESTIKFLEAIPFDYDRGDFIYVAEMIKKWAKFLGNGRNCATWFTRHLRAQLILALINHLKPQLESNHDRPEAQATFERYTKKVLGDFERQMGYPAWNQARLDHLDLSQVKFNGETFIENMEHFRTVDYPPIRDYHFGQQKLMTAMEEMRALEDTYKERANVVRRMVPLDGDKIILRCDHGFAWWLLDRPSCQQERKTMNHCGNTASPRAGQRILSLREYVGVNDDGQKEWIPHCTFIWNPDGSLGERKGYSNHKPAAKFFPYIKELFKQPYITGFVLGAHWSHNDVQVDDMPEGYQKEIIAANPKAIPIKTRISHDGMTDEIADEIADGVNKLGRDWWRLRGLHTSDLDDEQRRKLFDRHPELAGLKEYYATYGLDERLMKLMGDGFRSKGFAYFSEHNFRPRDMATEDRDRLWDTFPDMMTKQDRYDRFGMNDELMDILAQELADPLTASDVRAWMMNYVKKEDILALFDAHPLTMPPAMYYKKFGMTDEFTNFVAEHLAGTGPDKAAWFQNAGFNLPEDVIQGAVRLNASATDISREDFLKIFEGRKQLLLISFPMEYYKKFGLDENLMNFLGDAGAENGLNRLSRIFHFHEMAEEDLNRLLDEKKWLTTPHAYYKRHGLTDEFAEWLAEPANAEKVPDHMPAWNRGEGGPFLHDQHLSPEDLERFFVLHPRMMTHVQHYERRGLDEELLKEIEDGFEEEGHAWFRQYLDAPEIFKPEDLERLYEEHPEYMPWAMQEEKLPKKEIIENLNREQDMIINNFFNKFTLDENGEHVVLCSWDDIPDFISDFGSDELKTYSADDVDFDSYYHSDPDVDPVANIIPFAAQIAIGEYCRDEYVVEQNEEDEDDYDFDHTDFSEVIERLKDESDSIYDAMVSALFEGERYGAEAEAYKEVRSAIKNASNVALIGFFDYTEYEREVEGKKKKEIDWDGKVKWLCEVKDLVAYFTNEIGNDNYAHHDSLNELLENSSIPMNVPHYGFSGFDEDAALDRFWDECGDVLDNAPKNPYRKVVQGKVTWEIPDEEGMKAEITKVVHKMIDTVGAGNVARWMRTLVGVETEFDNRYASGDPSLDELEGEKLEETFRRVVKEYYLPY